MRQLRAGACATSPPPRTGFDRFFPALAQAAAEAAPVAGVQASMCVALDTHLPGAGSRSPRHPGDHLRRSACARRRHPRAAGAATVPARERGAVPALAAGVRLALGGRARPRRGIPGGHAGPAALAGAEPPADPHVRDVRGASATTTACPRGLDRLTRTATLARPLVDFINAGADHVQLPDAAVPQRREPAVGERLGRHDAAVLPLRSAGPARQRGRPGRDAGQRACARRRTQRQRASQTDDSFLHANPYPNTAAPGQVRECEAGNENYGGTACATAR